MDVRSLARPTSLLLSSARCSSTRASTLPLLATSSTTASTRGHKTTARTKRALKIAPHDSFLPSRSVDFPAADHIIYNPPASESSPFHTPLLFLPRSDPRRPALLQLRRSNSDADADLPPQMGRAQERKYNLTKEDVEEMKRLRRQDPLTWSVGRLAEKFGCSRHFVIMAAPAPTEHLEWLKGKEERRKARYGPIRTKADMDRKRRREMLYRGEL